MTPSGTFREHWGPCSDARGLAQTACNNRYLYPLSSARPRARLLLKNTCGTSHFCILSNTVPVFAKSVSYIDSFLPF